MTPHNYSKKYHPGNYSKLLTTISKKWIKVNNEGKNIMTIHYDTTTKQILNIVIIIPDKPLWPPSFYQHIKKKTN
jgi:hypothetical protein